MTFNKQISLKPSLLVRALVHRFRTDSLARNSIYIMSTTVVTAVIGYLYWIVATHIYSPHDIGLASALLSILGLTAILANLGIGPTLIQMLPGREKGKAWSLTLNAGLATGMLSGWLAGIIVVVALPHFSQQFAFVRQQAVYVLFFIVGVPLLVMATLLDQVFVAERTASNMLVRNAAHAALKLPLMVLLVTAGALGIFSSWILALVPTLILASLLLPRLKRGYCLAGRGMTGQVRKMLSSFVGHHFINLGGTLPAYLVPVFVFVRTSAAENAYYTIAGMVTSFLFIISPAVASALFAEGSHTAHDVLHKARSSALLISMLLGPAMLFLFLGGRYVLFLFGPGYAQHGLAVLLISTTIAVPDAITNIYVSVLRVQGRLGSAATLNLGMAALTLTLAWVLLPVLGITGAAWAYVISQTAGSLVVGVDIIRVHRKPGGKSRSAALSGQGLLKTEEKPCQQGEELPSRLSKND